MHTPRKIVLLHKILLIVVVSILHGWPAHVSAREAVAKQIHLVIQGSRLIASNVVSSRFDEFRLKPRERIIKKSIGNGALVVVTNDRIIAYGVASGWRSRDVKVNERVKEVSAEDYAVLVVTNKRMLNFNGQTGIWGTADLPILR